jgi:hypothetical protein
LGGYRDNPGQTIPAVFDLRFDFGSMEYDLDKVHFVDENLVLGVTTSSLIQQPRFTITTKDEVYHGYFSGYSVMHEILYTVMPYQFTIVGNAVFLGDKGGRIEGPLTMKLLFNSTSVPQDSGPMPTQYIFEGKAYDLYGFWMNGFASTNANLPLTETRLSNLEQWQKGINNTLNTLLNWLFYTKHSAGGSTMCNAVASECKAAKVNCTKAVDCGTDGYIGTPSCSGNNVFQSYVAYKCNNPGLSTASCSNTTTSQLKTACPKKCLSGACVDCLTAADCSAGQSCVSSVCQGTIPPPGGKCSFRTNAVNGNYASGTWIAVDVNGDGKLEGFGYYGSSGGLAACGGPTIAKTPQGYIVAVVNGKPQVCVPIAGGKIVQKNYYTASAAAVTSTGPTQPYTGNGQEVCTA